MRAFETMVAAAAGLGLVVGLFAHGFRVRWLNEPLLALLLGVLIGPAGLGWLDLSRHGDEREILDAAAKLTLALALVVAGLELRTFPRAHWRSLAVLLSGGTVLMWAVTSLLAMWLVGLEPLAAVLVGAVLAPIDPVLGATVATGRIAREHLPERIRLLLTAESSARHGLGLLWVLLPALLLTRPPGEAWTAWLVEGLLWKGLASAAAGVAAGYAAALAQRWSERRNLAEAPTGPLVALLVALALAVGAGVGLAGGDGVLAALAAGLAFAAGRTRARTSTGRAARAARARKEDEDEDEDEREIERQGRLYESLLKQVLQVPVFLLLGTALPWEHWAALGWRAPALAAAVLLLRRIPALLLLKPLVGQIRRWDEALFVGWFGSIGVGALGFAAAAHRETHLEEVWTVATLLIAASIVAHDLTATPLSRMLGRRIGAGEATRANER